MLFFVNNKFIFDNKLRFFIPFITYPIPLSVIPLSDNSNDKLVNYFNFSIPIKIPLHPLSFILF